MPGTGKRSRYGGTELAAVVISTRYAITGTENGAFCYQPSNVTSATPVRDGGKYVPTRLVCDVRY
eukprot:3449845-Rhodomonas_salina.3